jgi:hypothetical protein
MQSLSRRHRAVRAQPIAHLPPPGGPPHPDPSSRRRAIAALSSMAGTAHVDSRRGGEPIVLGHPLPTDSWRGRHELGAMAAAAATDVTQPAPTSDPGEHAP